MKPLLFILLGLFSTTLHAQFPEHIIGSHSIRSVVLADVDNDMDNDIVISGGLNNQLKWIENSDGLGNFTTVHGIFINPNYYAQYIAISDIDADNDVDILVTTSEMDNGEVRTFKNTDGIGNFEIFSAAMHTSGIQCPIEVADINGDTHNDWASSVSAWESGEPKVSWFKNTGNGNVTEHIIEESYVRSFQLKDIDGDNDIDLIGFNLNQPLNDPEIFWYENTDGLGNFEKHFIINISNLDYSSKLIAKDLDGDTDIDIIVAYDNILSWHKNDGQGNFGPANIINDNSNPKWNIMVLDLDSDGNLDIISANDNVVTYFRNDGQENFAEEIIINNIARTDSPFFAMDVNGDTKIDIVTNSSENGKISWYENNWVLSVDESTSPKFSIYPNPSKNVVNVQSSKEISHIKVFNQLGILVLSTITSENIDISFLDTGLYFMKIFTVDGSVGLKKLIRE